jgi:hypothetical protein
MSAYWFKPREYGYGATPVSWQGWAITVATMVVVVMSSLVVPALANGAALSAIVIDALAIAVLIIVSRRKTDGEWRWRWGQR